ncbi:response regulator [Halalkalibacterium halodurans]|nr:response regulator transcription factor [Halalkalibacterium halodurans]
MGLINVLIADDQTLMREGLKTIIDLEDDMNVTGLAKNGKEVLDQIPCLLPHVILMDIQMPIMNGIECLKVVKRIYPHINVLMLTTFEDDDYIIESLVGGANGFLLKDLNYDQLIYSIRQSVDGQMLIPNSIAVKLAKQLSKYNELTEVDLQIEKLKKEGLHFSERERQIASLLAQGLTNKKIAEKLYITEGTVKNYISEIYSKIGIRDRMQASTYLRDLGINDLYLAREKCIKRQAFLQPLNNTYSLHIVQKE